MRLEIYRGQKSNGEWVEGIISRHIFSLAFIDLRDGFPPVPVKLKTLEFVRFEEVNDGE